MKFGLLYNIDYHEHIHGTPSQYYGQILDQIVRAEELGYHNAWFGEHHYAAYSFGSPPVMAMAAAARTSTIKVGTGVATLPLHNPILLAEEYALLDVLSGGRLEWGVGRGFLKYGYDVIGIAEEESTSRYREALEIVIEAWTSAEPFSYKGKYWDIVDYMSFPPPMQKPHPPIFGTGAASPESYVWTGEMGLNLATSFFIPKQEMVRDGIRNYRAALKERGIDPKDRQVLSVMQMYCSEDDAEAREAWTYTSNYLQFFSGLDRKSPHRAKEYAAYAGDEGASQMGEIPFEFFDNANLSLIGPPDKLIEKLKWLDEYFEQPDILIMEVAQGGLDPARVIPTLERFASEVMPLFPD